MCHPMILYRSCSTSVNCQDKHGSVALGLSHLGWITYAVVYGDGSTYQLLVGICESCKSGVLLEQRPDHILCHRRDLQWRSSRKSGFLRRCQLLGKSMHVHWWCRFCDSAISTCLHRNLQQPRGCFSSTKRSSYAARFLYPILHASHEIVADIIKA